MTNRSITEDKVLSPRVAESRSHSDRVFGLVQSPLTM